MNKKAKIAIFSAVLLLIIVLVGLATYFVFYKNVLEKLLFEINNNKQ